MSVVSAVLVILCAMPQQTHALTPDFVNGQAATAVIGQADLFSTTGGTSAQSLSGPDGIAVDTVNGKIYVVDSDNSRVLRFDLDAARSSNPTAEAVFGQPDMTSSSWNRSTEANTLKFPNAAAVDSAGRLYVADNNNHRVLRYDTAVTATNGVAASAVLGQPYLDSNATGPRTQSNIVNPTALAFGPNGELWVADGNRLLRWDAPHLASNGGPADGVLGQPDFTTSQYTTSQASFGGTIYGIAITPDGTLFAADGQNNLIKRFDAAASKPDGANADAVLGQANFTATTAGQSATTLSGPVGLALDSSGRLYVADDDNRRVVWFDDAANLSNGAAAVGVLGDLDLNGTEVTENDRKLIEPKGIALSADNELWISQYGGARITLFTPAEEDTPDDEEPGGETPAAVPAQCDQLPDMAVSPQFIELTAGGTAQIEVALRNLCQDRPFNYADVLLSLSDGLVVTDIPAGWLNLGQRAAWQNLSLAPDETKRAVITVSAPNGVPAGPTHVTELYANGGVQKRIDGVFITPAPAPAAEPAPAVVVAAAPEAPEAPAPLPTTLPNTGGPLLPLGLLAAAGAALVGAGMVRLRRR